MKAPIRKPDQETIERAAELLRRGELVAIPTETVYGLAGDLTQPAALARIFETKNRPTFDPLIAHVAETGVPGVASLEAQGLVDARALTPRARKTADRLIAAFWPGPLTLVLPKTDRVPELATAGLQTVAIRMPDHPVAQAVLQAAGRALAAPSANRFGRLSPTTAQAVREELGEKIPLIIDGGPCTVGVESTILAFGPDGELLLLRPGGVASGDIEALIGEPVLIAQAHRPGDTPQPAPGMLESHYAPGTPLKLLPAGWQASASGAWAAGELAHLESARELRVGFVIFAGDPGQAARLLARALGVGEAQVTARGLSRDGDLAESAQNLFRVLRELDGLGLAAIFAEQCPSEQGLGRAIADRLKRASTQAR